MFTPDWGCGKWNFPPEEDPFGIWGTGETDPLGFELLRRSNLPSELTILNGAPRN